MKHSVVVIGGGIIGSSAAYFLRKSDRGVTVSVIEADSSYEKATTPMGAGGVRQQFSVVENIAQSQYSLDFYKNWDSHMSGVPDLPDLSFQEQGYLFVVSSEGTETLRRNAALQAEMGVQVEIMDRATLCRKFPSLQRNDIALSVYTPDDGWIDPNAALWGFRRAAEHHGASALIHSKRSALNGKIDAKPRR